MRGGSAAGANGHTPDGVDIGRPATVSALLSELAYLPPDEVRAVVRHHGYENCKTLDGFGGVEGLCVTDGDDAYISFRGTKQFADFLIDLLFLPFYWPLRHFGFGFSWRRVQKATKAWLADVDRPNVHLSGHSLGGAIALVAAHELRGEHNIASVSTFGAPRTFTWFSAVNLWLEERTQRFVNGSDIIAHAPLWLLSYQHAGRVRSVRHPGSANLSDHVVRVLEASSGTEGMQSTATKHLLRLFLTVYGLPVVFLATMGQAFVGLLRFTNRSAKSHARTRYLNNLGLLPLRLPDDPVVVMDETGDMSALAGHVFATVLGATIAGVFGSMTWALVVGLAMLVSWPVLLVLLWFYEEPDPIGALRRKISPDRVAKSPFHFSGSVPSSPDLWLPDLRETAADEDSAFAATSVEPRIGPSAIGGPLSGVGQTLLEAGYTWSGTEWLPPPSAIELHEHKADDDSRPE